MRLPLVVALLLPATVPLAPGAVAWCDQPMDAFCEGAESQGGRYCTLYAGYGTGEGIDVCMGGSRNDCHLIAEACRKVDGAVRVPPGVAAALP